MVGVLTADDAGNLAHVSAAALSGAVFSSEVCARMADGTFVSQADVAEMLWRIFQKTLTRFIQGVEGAFPFGC